MACVNPTCSCNTITPGVSGSVAISPSIGTTTTTGTIPLGWYTGYQQQPIHLGAESVADKFIYIRNPASEWVHIGDSESYNLQDALKKCANIIYLEYNGEIMLSKPIWLAIQDYVNEGGLYGLKLWEYLDKVFSKKPNNESSPSEGK